ncbi:MAG: preprotein translocase subunit YajC [Holosporales bacterium]|jgi:preprotein translocase subunit YajC|nr:preprotein translocase subunit YajC [Holosporales bacterium]
MFITPAYAAPAQQGSNMFMTMLPLVFIFGVMYFLMIRPQQKRAAEHQKAVEALKRGDRIVTNSGLIGEIARVKDSEFVLEIAENVQVSVLKNAVAGIYKGDSGATPSDAQGAKNEDVRRKQKRK